MTLPALLLAACLPLVSDGDRITAADLAQADPAFAALPPEAEFGYAPAPGTHRSFSAAELGRWARKYSLPIEPKAEVCLERAVAPLEPAKLMEAIRTSLDRADARIEIVDYCRHLAPRGKLEFTRAGLMAPPASQPNAAALWTGSVRYGGSRRFNVWVKARILVKAQRVLAAQALPVGARIEAAQLRLEEYEGFPLRAAPLDSLEKVVGQAPRRSIPAGSVISISQLSAPLAISRGDTVRVQVTSGDAHLELQGRAEAGGRAGEIIPVRNLANGKRFSARVEDPGRAVAEVHP